MFKQVKSALSGHFDYNPETGNCWPKKIDQNYHFFAKSKNVVKNSNDEKFSEIFSLLKCCPKYHSGSNQRLCMRLTLFLRS